jgi:hypothetical protein
MQEDDAVLNGGPAEDVTPEGAGVDEDAPVREERVVVSGVDHGQGALSYALHPRKGVALPLD